MGFLNGEDEQEKKQHPAAANILQNPICRWEVILMINKHVVGL